MQRFLFFLLCLCCRSLTAQSIPALYDDSRVSEIRLWMPADSLRYLLDQQVNDRYLRAHFLVFSDGTYRDTVRNVGLRLRGNTSLFAKKKSFKVSFNEFEPGRKYQGVKKLNLLGSHNDPTMVRQKLFYDVWGRANMPNRRGAFVKLYLNDEYRGLYTNLEEIDKAWLERVYGDDEGNLYKCTWPADLAYLGTDPAPYKAILNNPASRAYDLVTNEATDDYSRLVALITALHAPTDGSYVAKISALLNVPTVLKAYALDVATGNWDDYFYNKNNYYLYDNPQTGRFEFVTYDTDNSFGVDWLGKDWGLRNALAWHLASDPRPLATQLLAIPAYRQQFIQYLDTISRTLTCPDALGPRIDTLHNLVAPAAETDLYRTLDYGYTTTDFHKGFDTGIDGHTPYGVKSFLAARCQSTRTQIEPFLSAAHTASAVAKLHIRPNPSCGYYQISLDKAWQGEWVTLRLTDGTGRVVGSSEWQADLYPYALQTDGLLTGLYGVVVSSSSGQVATALLVVLK